MYWSDLSLTELRRAACNAAAAFSKLVEWSSFSMPRSVLPRCRHSCSLKKVKAMPATPTYTVLPLYPSPCASPCRSAWEWHVPISFRHCRLERPHQRASHRNAVIQRLRCRIKLLLA